MDIVTDADVSTGRSRPWTTNPIGISAILIPPPCPLKIVGRGRVCQVVVDDPGNGYPKPPDGGTGDNEYPVTLVLDGVEVTNPGINYNCGVDQHFNLVMVLNSHMTVTPLVELLMSM